jgi:hypothetical protein
LESFLGFWKPFLCVGFGVATIHPRWSLNQNHSDFESVLHCVGFILLGRRLIELEDCLYAKFQVSKGELATEINLYYFWVLFSFVWAPYIAYCGVIWHGEIVYINASLYSLLGGIFSLTRCIS